MPLRHIDEIGKDAVRAGKRMQRKPAVRAIGRRYRDEGGGRTAGKIDEKHEERDHRNRQCRTGGPVSPQKQTEISRAYPAGCPPARGHGRSPWEAPGPTGHHPRSSPLFIEATRLKSFNIFGTEPEETDNFWHRLDPGGHWDPHGAIEGVKTVRRTRGVFRQRRVRVARQTRVRLAFRQSRYRAIAPIRASHPRQRCPQRDVREPTARTEPAHPERGVFDDGHKDDPAVRGLTPIGRVRRSWRISWPKISARPPVGIRN